MPHVEISCYPGRTDKQKAECAEGVAEIIANTLGCNVSGVSVAIKEVNQADWKTEVWDKQIVPAEENQLNTVRDITQQTISEIYPKYYPSGAVDYFKAHHSDSNILADIRKGIVFLLKADGDYVGTVTISENEINRLFVRPEFQHQGYGRRLLDFAEEEISKNYSEIVINASLPARKIYQKRGYHETEYNQIITDSKDVLCYDVMKKKF